MKPSQRKVSPIRIMIAAAIALGVVAGATWSYIGLGSRPIPVDTPGVEVEEVVLSDLEGIIAEHGTVFLYFYSPTCPGCELFEPVLIDVATIHEVTLLKMNVFDPVNDGLTKDYRIRRVPAVFAYHAGELFERMDGHADREDIDALIKRVLAADEVPHH